MKFFNSTQTINLMIVDAPRSSWRVVPPAKWHVIATFAVIVVSAVVWGLL